MKGLHIGPMVVEDLDAVMEIEAQAFSTPWTKGMYLHELEKGDGCYLAARFSGRLAAYRGTLLILEEAHVMTLAVREDMRRRGLGTRLLLELMTASAGMGARFLTLEVRESNRAAIGLYGSLGFRVTGERRHYYLDNMENALIMWTEDLTSPRYRRFLEDILERGGYGG